MTQQNDIIAPQNKNIQITHEKREQMLAYIDSIPHPLEPDLNFKIPLGDFLDAFMRENAITSEETARKYGYACRQFLLWLSEHHRKAYQAEGLYPLARKPVTKDDLWEYQGIAGILRNVKLDTLKAYRQYLKALVVAVINNEPKYLKGDTIDGYMAAVRSFLNYALAQNILDPNDASSLGLRARKERDHSPKNSGPQGKRLSVKEVHKLFLATKALSDNRAAKNAKSQVYQNRRIVRATRDRAILAVFVYLGLRRQEVADIRLNHFKKDGEKLDLHVQGKGRKIRQLTINNTPALAFIKRWLNLVNTQLQPDIPYQLGHSDNHLFPAVHRSGSIVAKEGKLRGLTTQSVHDIVVEISEAAKVKGNDNAHITPHDLRRTAARNAYDNAALVTDVQQFLGHSSPLVTMVYLGLTKDDAAKAIDSIKYDGTPIPLDIDEREF